mgnify:CR=1 FL=1
MAQGRGFNSTNDSDKKVTLSKEKIKKALKIFQYIKPYRVHFIIGLILLSASSLLFMIFPGAAGEMANTATGKGKLSIPVRNFGWIFLVILVIQGVISYFRTTLFAYVSEKGMADLRKSLYNKIMTLDITYFESRRVGELSSRLTADVNQLQEVFSITLAEFIRQLVILIAGLIILGFLAPKLSLLMLLTFPFIVVLAMFFGRYVRNISKERQDELANSNVIVDETLQSFHTVKSFTNENFESKRYAKSIDELVKISMKSARIRGIFFTFIITILFGGIFFILWRGAILVESGDMQVGDLFSFIIYTGLIGGAIASIGSLYTSIASAIGATERILEILETPSEISLSDSNIDYQRFEGNIAFDHVSFSYPSRPDVKVLNDISLDIGKGKSIALVGASGVGKSTIIQLLLQYYKPNSGAIYVDGKDITAYNLTGYRKNIALVPQEVLLFGGTIRENLLYGKPNATDEELKEAAIKANAWEFIASFPDQLNTLVGERGVKLSGGQRQRIAIARAILRDPTILLLDEATSSLDAESEKLVQEALQKLMKGRTSIIIAHRLSTIRDVDCIYVLEKGKIVEQGTHSELSAIQNGVYNSLARLQFSND